MRGMPARAFTADELLRLPRNRGRHELVHGELRTMSPAGWQHGIVAAACTRLLANHVVEHGLGKVFAAETGFLIARDPDTVLAPDVAFVRSDRLPGAATGGFFPGAPDLAVEVRSPNDSAFDVEDKARAWLAHGCAMVVTIDPGARTAAVWRAGSPPRAVTTLGTIDAAEIVPGLRLRLADLFAP